MPRFTSIRTTICNIRRAFRGRFRPDRLVGWLGVTPLRFCTRVCSGIKSGTSFGGRRNVFALHAGLIGVIVAGTFGSYAMGEETPVAAPIIEPAAVVEPPAKLEPFELTGPTVDRLSAGQAAPVLVEVTRSYPFIWPAVGPITSYIGSQHPLGIDIGLDNGSDVAVVATAAGVVTFAGGSDADDYGFYVKVDHGNGLVSLYAHLDEIGVRNGQAVTQGAVIGLGGNTGKSDGKHLHFEIINLGQTMDPLKLLPQLVKPDERVSVDCGVSAIVLNQGSQASFDFTAALGGRPLVDAVLEPLTPRTGTAPVWAVVNGASSVQMTTQPAIGGRDEQFRLKAIPEGANSSAVLECDVLIKPMSVAPTFYVRAAEPTAVPRTAVPTSTAESEEAEGGATIPNASLPTSTSTPGVTPTVPPVVTATPATTTTPVATTSVTPVVSATPVPATAIPTGTLPPTSTTQPATATPTRTATPTPNP